MKKWSKQSFAYLMIATLSMTQLIANETTAEPTENNEPIRAEISTTRSVHDDNELKELRAQEDLANQENKDQIPREEHPMEEKEGSEADTEFLKMSYESYVHTHPGAMHYVENISNNGAALEIEDGSIWDIKGSDRGTIKDWRHHDIIVLLPNRDWFSSYDYKFHNINTNEKVRANIFLGPIIDLQTTHYIEEINHSRRFIRLEDGSTWSMSRWDDSVLRLFERYDVVIIGTNDGWWKGSNPNILVHVKTMKYARGSREN